MQIPKLGAVLRQSFDHATIANLALAALFNHASQFRTKRHKLSDAPINLAKATLGDAFPCGAHGPSHEREGRDDRRAPQSRRTNPAE